MKDSINISVIGWWSWTFNVLYWLKKVELDKEKNLAAIIAMTDSGGTTWYIRDKYWVLPPWDIRRWIAALAENTWFVRKLFEYKFDWEEWVIWWNKIGNILLTALNDITWSFEAGLDEACKMFRVKGKVIPVTLEDVHLWVRFEDGTEVIWEKNIDVSSKNSEEKTHNVDQNIVDAFLVWGEWKINPKAYDTLVSSDIIKNIEKYAWEVIDYVFVNNWHISDDLVAKYKLEWKKPVKLKVEHDFSWKKYKIVERDFLDESDLVRHSPTKLAKTIVDIIEGWIK